ncbi:MAG: succinylglutamate desuccinylase/aspartoacylase family protein [Cyclobacteriaceae bacterium]
MKNNRRDFLRITGMAGIGLASASTLPAPAFHVRSTRRSNEVVVENAVATLEKGSALSTPYWRVESGREGPSLLLIAAQHGNEVQGAEVARRFMEVCARQLVAGTVWLIPMAELRGIRIRRYTVESGPELRIEDKAFHRSWPGSPTGNDTERVAYALDQAVVRHCSHAVDMHCWTQVTAAMTFAQIDHKPSRSMAEVTTTRFITYRNAPDVTRNEKLMFGPLMYKRGTAFTVMELSGQYQMQERQVQTGLSSMVNIAKLLGMIEGEPRLPDGPRVAQSPEANHEVLAPCSGIFVPAVGNDKSTMLTPDDYVRAGSQLGHIIRDGDLETIPIIAPVSGYLAKYGLCHWGVCDASLPALHPYAEQGETVANIVTV